MKIETMQKETKEIIIRKVPEQLRRDLKVQAAKEGRPMNDIILEIIKKYVEGKR